MPTAVARQEPSTPSRIFQFGPFEFHSETGELRKHGVRIKLGGQPVSVLKMLLERPGEVITREDLQKRLWPEGTYVDFEHSTNAAVKRLRQALCDSADSPCFVETLARNGYRFIAPVSLRPGNITAPITALGSDLPRTVVHRDVTLKRTSVRPLQAVIAAIVVITAIAGGFAVLLWRIPKLNQSYREPAEPAVPLTANRGLEQFPAFSPDGTRVAFSWKPPGERVPNIYVKLVGQGEAVRLTMNSAGDFAPAWSPDGVWVAFLRARPGFGASITVISALGGRERQVAEISLSTEELLRFWESTNVTPPFLAWSADAHWLLALEQKIPHGAFSIVRFSVDTGVKHVLTFPPKGTFGDGGLSVSPDGKTLAFTRNLALFEKDIFLVPLSEDMLLRGTPTRLTFDNKEMDGLAWTPDGRRLVFSSKRGGPRGLWEVSVAPPSEPIQLRAAGDEPYELAIAQQRSYLAYVHRTDDLHVWRLRLDGNKRQQAQMFIASTRMEHLARYSPDGRSIAYQSGRSGYQNIWVCNADGSHPVQLTALRNAWAGSPRWSPDGQKITFDSNLSGNWHIYVIGAQGGQPVQLTKTNTQEFRPSWSHDGKWIYFCSPRTGQPQVWKVPSTGGTTVPVTKNGGGVAFESTDGEDLYYAKNRQLWKMPTSGGNETLVLPSLLDNNYAPVKRGIYFLQGTDSDTRLRLQFLNFATDAIQNVGTVPGPSADEISISPDERWFLYGTMSGAGSELMLIKNFR